MKIAYFLGALSRGGAETQILDICRQHEKVPYDFVCVYRHEGNMSEEFLETGAPMIQIQKKQGYFRYMLDIRRTLMQEHVTIVHSQTPSNTIVLALALVDTGIQIVTTFHGHSFADSIWWKRKVVYSACERIICVSKNEKAYYETKWRLPKENKLQVVYNGIDFTKFNQESVRVREFENNEERLRLCMVGNFAKGRSQMVVCKAIKLIVKSVAWKDKLDFYFIGRRDDKEPWRYDNCVKYSEENQLTNIYFLGSRNDVPELLRTMDGLVYSTEHDTFGVAVVEAMAVGLPIVVNNYPVIEEVCGEANEGVRYFRTEDVGDAADKIAELLTNLETSKKVAQKNAIKVRNKYSITTHIQNVYSIYQSL